MRGSLSQRQGDTNLEPWGVTYKILLFIYLFIIIIYLFLMCTIKKERQRKESKRTDALKVAKETRATGAVPRL